MWRPRVIAVAIFLFTGLQPVGHTAENDVLSYLDNGVVRIGIDLSIGGAITHLSASGGGANIINSHDWGRQVQMSFYSGPVPFLPDGKEPAPTWRFLGWNPIQSGDSFGNRSKVLTHTNDGTTLYVKCIPMQWPLDNVPGECTFETWITLEGAAAHVRSKITNARADTTVYPARGQELPAVYTNGPYYRLMTYDGDAPYTGGETRRITKVWDTRQGPQEVEGGPWDHWYATESWAALVNDDDFGVGVWSPGTHTFVGGFAGTPGSGGPKDGPTGYIAPIRRETLDHNIEYDYEYVLIVGQLDAIRGHVYEHADRASLPDYRFAADRQSWTLDNVTDEGWPLDGEWRITTGDTPATLRGPAGYWDAAAMPRLYIEAAYGGGHDQGEIRWERFGKSGATKWGRMPLSFRPDGVRRTYVVDLSESLHYRGPCSRLEMRLPPNTHIALRRVSHSPSP